MIDKLFGDTLTAESRALDAASLRQGVIANNLANASTPGYKRREVEFETDLSRALAAKNDPAAGRLSVSAVQPRVVTINSTSERADGNNVNLETENIKLATNALKFEVLAQTVAGYFSGLKAAISGK